MICLSFSEQYYAYSQISKNDSSYLIDFIKRKKYPEPGLPTDIFGNDFFRILKELLSKISQDITISDKNISISIPASWTDIYLNTLDVGFSPEETKAILDKQSQRRFGDIYKKKFIQYYPIAFKDEDTIKKYLTVSYYKELGKIFMKAAEPVGLNILTLDLNLFSAANAINFLEKPIQNNWGVWLVGNENENQQVITVESGEISHFVEFVFSKDEKYEIIQSSSTDQSVEQILFELSQLIKKPKINIDCLDQLYIYSNQSDCKLFNDIQKYNIKNLRIIDPIDNFEISEIDDDFVKDNNLQYLDLIGLISREISGGIDD